MDPETNDAREVTADGGSDTVKCCGRKTAKKKTCMAISICSCCVATGVVVLLLAIIMGVMVSQGITGLQGSVRSHSEEWKSPDNLAGYVWLPGCPEGNKTDAQIDKCGGTCYNSSQIRSIENFFKQNTWKLVNFSSLAGPEHESPDGQNPVFISAWYMAPDPSVWSGPSPAPRVVLQHGTNEHANSFVSQAIGFYLASAGFGVIIPSLMDHGRSGDSKLKKFSWGWEYPYVTLAAIDYAKNDPDGLLGGTLPANKVGVAGVSMGGFLASTIFGMRGDIPGLWADAPVYNVQDIINQELGNAAGPFGVLGRNFGWMFTKNIVRVHYNHPGKTLPTGPATQRKVYLVQDIEDKRVEADQLDKYRSFISSNADKYTLAGEWKDAARCNGENHRMFAYKFPTQYREKLCAFWAEVFSVPSNQCSKSMWPIYG